MVFFEKAAAWLLENLYNYMIPICLLCIWRLFICFLEMRHMKRLRDKKFVFRKVSNHYKEIGTFIGLFIGSVLVCVLPWKILWGVVAVALAVLGFKIGTKRGAAADEFWSQVVDEIAASEEAEKLENAPVVDNDVGALLDTLDVYDDEEKENDAEAVETAASVVTEEAAGAVEPAAENEEA